MSTFNEANLVKKLENVTSSQDSIQTLSLWILHHRNHYKKIVDQWLKCYIKAKSDHQLALFYLANDIVQHAKRKNLTHYLNEYMNALREATKVTNDEKIMNNINRVLNIWQERSVYSKEYIDELRELLCGEKIKAEVISKIISDFSLNDVINQINNIVKIEQFTRSKFQNLVNCKIDFANSDLLNKLKDKSYGDQFSKELDEATKCLESTIMAIEKEITSRKALLTTLKKSKIFYAIQMKESKNIAETFNNCEVHLKQVQAKLNSCGYNFSSLNMSSELNTSQLSSVLNFFQQTNSTNISSLDQRLTSLMSGTGQFTLSLDQNPYVQNKNFNTNNKLPNEFYLNDKKKEVNQIESVITSRPFSNENPPENFEPADMDLGDSEDEDRHLTYNDGDPQKSIPSSLSFIAGQDMAGLLPLIPPPPPPPMPPPTFKEFLGSSIENDLETFRTPPPANIVSNIPSHADTNNFQIGDSIRSVSSKRHSHRNSSYHHHHPSNNSNQWRNSSGDNNNRYQNNRHSQSYNYSNINNNRQSRWKNGGGSGGAGGSWKRANYQ